LINFQDFLFCFYRKPTAPELDLEANQKTNRKQSTQEDKDTRNYSTLRSYTQALQPKNRTKIQGIENRTEVLLAI
jgi:hypothetical protein